MGDFWYFVEDFGNLIIRLIVLIMFGDFWEVLFDFLVI